MFPSRPLPRRFYAGAWPPPPPQSYYVVPVPPPLPPPPPGVVVRPVWTANADTEVALLASVAVHARYVAISVHYPGVVHSTGGGQDHLNALTDEQRYETLKLNVDALKPLQVGVAVCGCHGGLVAWEFNLCDFDPAVDTSAPNSIAYLAGRGLDVGALRRAGIPAAALAENLRACGLLGRRRGLTWITHTGAYHVAYFLKVITGGAPLPERMEGFLSGVRSHLGDEVYDVAVMAADCHGMPRGLERIAGHLRLPSPLWSPRLAGAAGLQALMCFLVLRHGELGATFRSYRRLLQGLQNPDYMRT